MCCQDQQRQYSSQGEFNWKIHCDETPQKRGCHFEMQLLLPCYTLIPCTMMIDESKSAQSLSNVFLPNIGFRCAAFKEKRLCELLYLCLHCFRLAKEVGVYRL